MIVPLLGILAVAIVVALALFTGAIGMLLHHPVWLAVGIAAVVVAVILHKRVTRL
jgi:hypothetical protein